MQSAYHNLPTIGGVMQHEGAPYRASDLHYQSTGTQASFRANLATAYPKEAGARRWTRTLTLDRTTGVVAIAEDFILDQPVDVSLSLMTAVQPAIQPDGIRIGSALLVFNASELQPAVEKIPITDDALRHSWGDAVYRLRLNSATPISKAVWKLELRAVQT
jgi:hypothetical protein